MSGPTIRRKWRPTLAMVIYPVLLAVLAMPLALIVWFHGADGALQGFAGAGLWALALVTIPTLVVGFVFARTLTGPINDLIGWAEKIGRGGREAIDVPPQQGTREIARLSQTFLDLAQRLLDRTEYVRSFAAHVSHELKSPLTSIRGAAELLLEGHMSEKERQKFLTHIVADSDRLAHLLDRLRELAEAEQPIRAGTTTLAAVVAHLGETRSGLPTRISGHIDLPLAISLEAAAIVLGQLADNAGEHGATLFALEARETDEGAILTITDNGIGISESNRIKVFEPFFTTKREQGGTGMGLRIARTMLEAHGGTIALLPTTVGVKFEIRVPLVAPQSP